MRTLKLARSSLFAVVLFISTAVAGAQEARTIVLSAPMELAGRWNFNRGEASNTWSVRIEKLHDDGRIEGLITYWGRACAAKDTPLKESSWREGVLRLRASGGSTCGDMHFELKPGQQRLLEGEIRADFNPSIRAAVWLDRR